MCLSFSATDYRQLLSLVVPRGFKRFWATIIWTGMGVGYGLLGGGNGLARMEETIEVKRKGIGRVLVRN